MAYFRQRVYQMGWSTNLFYIKFIFQVIIFKINRMILSCDKDDGFGLSLESQWNGDRHSL